MKHLMLYEDWFHKAAPETDPMLKEIMDKGQTVAFVYPPARGIMTVLMKAAEKSKKLIGYFDLGFMNPGMVPSFMQLCQKEGILIFDSADKAEPGFNKDLAHALSKSEHKATVILASHKEVNEFAIFPTVTK